MESRVYVHGVEFKGGVSCLNPCSNGIACILKLFEHSLRARVSLNPCSNGIACIRLSGRQAQSKYSLNPCSNGIACIQELNTFEEERTQS